jgi:AcrR family transcriptional regulator
VQAGKQYALPLVAAPTTRREPLTRDDIVAAALQVTERGGVEAVTMRAVATELGVTPMALYHHVEGKQELVDLLVASVQSQYDSLSLGPDGWEASLRRYLLSMWDVLSRYPGVTGYLTAQPTFGTTPRSFAGGVQFFEQAGFGPRDARLTWSFVLTYIHGRLHVDAIQRGKATGTRIDGLRRRDYVEFGVDRVIASLRELLES